MIGDKLKPCPFCGGESQVISTKDQSGYWYAECKQCFSRQLAYSKDPDEAAARWNQRATNNALAGGEV